MSWAELHGLQRRRWPHHPIMFESARRSIPTVASLRRQQRRLDRRRLSADRVIIAMRDHNESLHCAFSRSSGTTWWLSPSGRSVAPEAAKLVTFHADVVAVGDSLFRNALSQTFRFVK
jgi:hypothetical protein